MNCIAIWCSSENTKSAREQNLETHFNLWTLTQNGQPRCFLDIGLMIQDPTQISHVNIYIPGTVNTSDIEDLGITFRKKPDLVSSLFNEDYRVSSRAQEKIVEVLDINRAQIFNIYILDLNSDVVIEKEFGGSTIRIRIPPELANKKHYYRIRLKNPYVDTISRNYTPPNSWLEGAFSQTELVDFRLNEKRNLDSSLLEKMRSEVQVIFTKTHLFLMREASDDYVYSHKPPNASRQLEVDSWKEYIGRDYSFDKIITYNWKETNPHGSFSAFAKFKFIRSNPVTIGTFIFVLVVIGVLSSLLANVLYRLLVHA